MLKRMITGGLRSLAGLTGRLVIDDPNYRGRNWIIKRLPFPLKGYKFRRTLKNNRPNRFDAKDRAHANGWIGWFNNRQEARRLAKRRREHRLLNKVKTRYAILEGR